MDENLTADVLRTSIHSGPSYADLQAENVRLRELLRRAKRLRLLVRICNYSEPHLAEYALAKKETIEIEAAIDAALKGAE